MIEIYESNFESDIKKSGVTESGYWPYTSEANSLEEDIFEEYDHLDIVKINDNLYKYTNRYDSDYFYISTDPEEIYKQIKKDRIESL